MRLGHGFHRQQFQAALDEDLQAVVPFSTKKWEQFKTVVDTVIAKSILGPKHRVHHDWFDENDEQVTQLLQEGPMLPDITTQALPPKQTGLNA